MPQGFVGDVFLSCHIPIFFLALVTNTGKLLTKPFLSFFFRHTEYISSQRTYCYVVDKGRPHVTLLEPIST